MQTTLELVHDLSDTQVIEVVKELFNTVYKEVPYNEVRNNCQGVAEVEQLVSLNTEVMKHELSASDSVRFGRLVLEQYACDAGLAPFVQRALEKVDKSDDLIIDVIVGVGLVVNLTLLVATTEVKWQKGPDGKTKLVIVKRGAGPEILRAILNPFVKLAKSLAVTS